MELGDTLFASVMFLVGFITFRVTSLKRFMDVLGAMISIFSLYSIATKPELLAAYIIHVPISYIGGAVTHLTYLIGANFGRADQFGEDVNWRRILIYAIVLVGLIILLVNINPVIRNQIH